MYSLTTNNKPPWPCCSNPSWLARGRLQLSSLTIDCDLRLLIAGVYLDDTVALTITSKTERHFLHWGFLFLLQLTSLLLSQLLQAPGVDQNEKVEIDLRECFGLILFPACPPTFLIFFFFMPPWWITYCIEMQTVNHSFISLCHLFLFIFLSWLSSYAGWKIFVSSLPSEKNGWLHAKRISQSQHTQGRGYKPSSRRWELSGVLYQQPPPPSQQTQCIAMRHIQHFYLG